MRHRNELRFSSTANPRGAVTSMTCMPAGGVPTLLKAIEPLLDHSTRGVTGRSLGQLLGDTPARPTWQATIRSLDNPVKPSGSLVTLHGTLAPRGLCSRRRRAVELCLHTGALRSCSNRQRMSLGESTTPWESRRGTSWSCETQALWRRNARSRLLTHPQVSRRGGRQRYGSCLRCAMSGTAYGTVILHCCPESAVGGPLALVTDGDLIELDVAERRLDLLVAPEVLAAPIDVESPMRAARLAEAV